MTAANLQRLVDATCAIRSYQATIDDPENPGNQIPNPETPGQFTKRHWWGQMKQEVLTHEANEADRLARTTSADLGDGE